MNLHQTDLFKIGGGFQIFTELLAHIGRSFVCKFFYDFWIFQCIKCFLIHNNSSLLNWLNLPVSILHALGRNEKKNVKFCS